MRGRVLLNILSVIIVAFAPFELLSAQETAPPAVGDTTINREEILNRLNGYYDSLNKLSQQLSQTKSRDMLQSLDKELKRIDLKWNGYYLANERTVSADDDMITIVVDWKTLLQQMNDSLSYKQGLCQAEVEFDRVMGEMRVQDSLYDDLVAQAIGLSLVKSMAKPLDELKAGDLVTIEGVNSSYGVVKQLSQQYAELKPGMDSLDRLYIDIKRRSEVVQAQKFKPLFDRVKDYLMGLAAVAMILMFLNMAQAKLKQIKGESKRLKELKKMADKQRQYPTI